MSKLGNQQVPLSEFTATKSMSDTTACPIRNVLGRFGDAWTLLTLLTLAEGERRFMDLKRTLPNPSQKVLTQTLRQLERDGFVSRTVIPTVPISVTYTLTELGESFVVPARSLLDWAHQANPSVNAARQAYDAAGGSA